MGFLDTTKLSRFAVWMEQTGWQKLQKLVLILLACAVILWAVRLVGHAVRRAVDDGNDNVTTDAERRAHTLSSVLNQAAWVLVSIFFLLASLHEFGINIGPLLAGAGIAGVALGFGAQSLVKDVIAGFFILMENQFGVGDVISVDDTHTGEVERMSLRVTLIRDLQGKAHYLPNGSFSRVVVMSKDFARALVDVDVACDSDIDQVIQILKETGAALAQDWPDKILEPTEVLGVEGFGPNGVMVRTLTKVFPAKQWEVAREYRRRVLIAFRRAAVAIPFPQRIIHHQETPIVPTRTLSE